MGPFRVTEGTPYRVRDTGHVPPCPVVRSADPKCVHGGRLRRTVLPLKGRMDDQDPVFLRFHGTVVYLVAQIPVAQIPLSLLFWQLGRL